MFKKGPDIDKKKLLSKALDVKKDSLTRLKHFRTLIEHYDLNEIILLFKSNFSFIYHTFIDTFSTFDCNSKQRREDLECILFMLDRILIYNPELIRKRWQFYSITFVMQKLLHRNNTWELRQTGVRLFVLWYQILADETNPELQTMFASLVPNIIPPSSLPIQQQQHIGSTSPTMSAETMAGYPIHSSNSQQHFAINNPSAHFNNTTFNNNINNNNNNNNNYNNSENINVPQLPIKLCSVEPLVPIAANEQLPGDETSFYLDHLLQYMVTQVTKPIWSPESAKKNQEHGFSFIFNMFKKIYLSHLYPNFTLPLELTTGPYYMNHSIDQYVDDSTSFDSSNRGGQVGSPSLSSSKRDPLQINLRQPNIMIQQNSVNMTSLEIERSIVLSGYQAIIIKWLTRILRQDMIPGQDDLIKGGSAERVDRKTGGDAPGPEQNPEYNYSAEGKSITRFQGVEMSSREMDIARKCIGTWPENIAVVHELFRRSFLNYYQPASMKRVVNVYKEWICNGGPNQSGQGGRNIKLGYTSFSDLLQTFVNSSCNAFVTRVYNPSMLDEQVELCKRIMNIYRFMVMKIYMNTTTWEQLLNVMLSITARLFPRIPPEKKDCSIGGRIAPAFFQTFIVSWIRANLYVHISDQMWNQFHQEMRNLVRWRELIEEWSTTMGSLTRVLVKHVYGLSLADLPLDKPQERRRRPKALKSLSTAETTPTKYPDQSNRGPFAKNAPSVTNIRIPKNGQAPSTRRGSEKMNERSLKYSNFRALVRSNSDGTLYKSTKHYYSFLRSEPRELSDNELRRIKSEYLLTDHYDTTDCRSELTTQDEVTVEGTSLRDSNMLFDNDSNIESSVKTSDVSNISAESKQSDNKRQHAEKCVLLGGNARGWTNENSVVMWRRMLGLFGNINCIENPDNHLIAIRCLDSMLKDFLKTRENLGISMDNQSTPQQPNLIPPSTYNVAWLLETTQLPRQYKESRLEAYKLLCQMSIRRHDLELPQQYFAAFYEALLRGLMSPDPQVYGTIIENSTQLLSLELPGGTFLVHFLTERSREILLDSPKETSLEAIPKDQAVQILNNILALNRPIKKLMIFRAEPNNPYNLVASGDIKAKIFDTLIIYNNRSSLLEDHYRSKSLCSLAIHVYQELCDRSDSFEVEKLFDVIFTDLQHSNDSSSFRMNCDLLRLFSDHASWLASSRPVLVSSLIQIICELVVRDSTSSDNKEIIYCLLICLEDWCISVGKNYLVKPINQLSSEEAGDDLSKSLNESLITVVLRSLENVINDEQFLDDSSNKGTKGSLSTSKGSDTHSSGRQSQQSSNSNDRGQAWSRTMTNANANQKDKIELDPETKRNSEAIKLACKVSHSRLITYLGHFPLRQVGASSMSCCVNEVDYLDAEQETSTNNDLKNEPGIQILSVNDTTLISFIGAPSKNHVQEYRSPIHLIIRNLCGKYSWEISDTILYETNTANALDSDVSETDSIVLDPDSFQDVSRSTMKYEPDFAEESNSSGSMCSRSSANRDCICDLMNQLGHSIVSSSTSSSINNDSCQQRRSSNQIGLTSSRFRLVQAEETMIALLTNQQFQELNYCDRSDDYDRVVLRLKNGNEFVYNEQHRITDFVQRQSQLSFKQCRHLLQQLGYLSWEKRKKVESLTKSARLLRELKNLDAQPSRETHKIAVIYVANGQEDKNSILMNSLGSRAFDSFVSGLGWEVNLSSHLGFMGGLQSNKSTGETSTYYCNSTTEIMFHVSTRIPLNNFADDEALNKKLRHLGNDEIHIVWSEHSRDYRRGIIPTEFGDVIIAIYPMLTFLGYYRIQISSKQDVPMFGPLFDNCIVHQTSLAGLVRATAVNAGRAKRLKLPLYRSYFEERSRLIDTIVNNHREILSFEEFAIQMYGTSVKPGHLSQATAAASEATTATC